MRIPKVTNLKSPRTGNPVANQFVIKLDDGYYFQSYETVIAYMPLNYNQESIILDPDWAYSVTTLKYLKQFLGINESKKRIEKLIDLGIYKVESLNQ